MLPVLGIDLPEMGKQQSRASKASLTSALFSSTQAKLLALLFGQPRRSFYTSEIIDHVDAGSGAVQRQLKKLVDAELVDVFPVGRQTHYRANEGSPIFRELCSILRKTAGVAEPLRAALAPLAGEIVLGLVYGSVAKGTDTSSSDIDLLLVSETLTLEEVYRALASTEEELGRPIRPTLYTPDELTRRLRKSEFLRRVLGGDVMLLLGEIPDVDP